MPTWFFLVLACDATPVPIDPDACDTPWYRDDDGDGWGSGDALEACDPPAGHAPTDGDCDDRDAGVHPDQAETCDGLDQDCDGATDEDATDAQYAYVDTDGDGFVGIAVALSCEGSATQAPDDCDDADPSIHPDAIEACDGWDNDCDGLVDEADPSLDAPLYYADGDGDGYGGGPPIPSCSPEGHTLNSLDCDDGRAEVHPGADEICDARDTDCDGSREALVPTDHVTITDALNAAAEGALVCVEEGTYTETLFIDRDVMLVSVGGADRTVIDGGGAGTVVTFFEEDVTDETLFQGFEVTGGVANAGGGIRIDGADPVLADLRVTGNEASTGAGVYVQWSDPTLVNVDVVDNACPEANSKGCGVFGWYTDLTLANVRILGNRHDLAVGVYEATSSGIGIYFQGLDADDTLELTNVIVAGNGASSGSPGGANALGGGLYMAAGSLVVTNSVFFRNSAGAGGGLAFATTMNTEVTNTIVSENVGTDGGGGVLMWDWTGDLDDFAFSLVSGNLPDEVYAESDPTTGVGALDGDPLFTDTTGMLPEGWDLTLDPASPCRDAGDPTVHDSDGTRSDLGAYGGPWGEAW